MIFYIIPGFIAIVFIFAIINKVNAYQTFIKGAHEGMNFAISIFPYILSMVFATSVIKASYLIQDILKVIELGLPYELIMQGAFRPISSNAALATMIDIFNTYGVDSKMGITSSVLEGSSETTIYVITLYFGSVGIVKYRYALKVGLLADLIGFLLTFFALYYL